MRKYFLSLMALLCLLSLIVNAQFQDDFSDLDLGVNPVWQGEIAKFVNTPGHQLRLMDSNTTGSAYLSTFSEAIENATWEMEIILDFNPSSSNYLKVYLTSDNHDLNAELQGYYLKMGGTEDEISLYRQEGSVSTKIIDGIDGRLNQSTNHLKIRVIHSLSGSWEIYEDTQLDGQFQLSGQAQDDQIPFSTYFGVVCKYTSTRSDKFYFDNILVTGSPYSDHDPPAVDQIEVIDDQHLMVTFNEAIEPSTGNDITRYRISGVQDLISSTTKDSINWLISIPTGISNGQYLDLMINALEDLHGNQLFDTINFLFYYPEPVNHRDLVINELLPDPEPVVGLPAWEFIEFYNNSEKVFMLEDWVLTDFSTEVLLPAVMIQPHEYVVFYPPGYTHELPSNAFTLNAWPSLNNSGDSILLLDRDLSIVDLVAYNTSWYHNDLKDAGGWSIEQINPDLNCANLNNWAASVDAAGGTPGRANSIFDLSPDLEGPLVKSISVESPAQVLIQFEEPVDFPESTAHIFTFDPPNRVLDILSTSGTASYLLNLEDSLIQEQKTTIRIDSIFDCNQNKMLLHEGQLFYDTTPPHVSAWKVYSDQQIQITTNEACNPDFILLGDLWKEKPKAVDNFNFILTSEESFLSDILYEVELAGLSDSIGNLNPDTIRFEFDFFTQLDSVTATGQNSLDVYFEKVVQPDSAILIQNYLLDETGNPFLVIIDNSNPKLVHLFFETNFEEGRTYGILFETIYDLDLQPLVLPGTTFHFDQSSPDLLQAEFLSDSTISLIFDESISEYEAELTSNYEINGFGTPVNAILTTDNEVLLTFSFKVPSETDVKLSISGIADLAGNAIARTKNVWLQYDLLPPAIIDHYILSSRIVTLTVNEPIDSISALPENFYLEEVGTPDSVHMDLQSNNIYLVYAFPIPARDSLRLSIFHFMDEAGHGYNDTYTLDLNASEFTLSSIQVLSRNKILLWFSDEVSIESLICDNFIYNQFILPDSVFYVAGDSSRIGIEFNDTLTFGENNLLTVNELRNLSGSDQTTDSINYSFFQVVESVTIKYPNEIEINYSIPLPPTVISELNSFQLFQGETKINPAKAILNSKGNKLKLFFPFQFEPDLIYSFIQDPIQLDFERWLPAYEAEVYLDEQPPLIKSYQVFSNRIVLAFSESLLPKSVSAPDHYLLNEGTLPDEIRYDEKNVELLFAEEIDSVASSSLKITKIQDQHLNTIKDTTIYFIYAPPYQVRPGDLIITEVMVDPTPSAGLSEHQYVEIYNNSDQKIQLSQLLLGDQRDLVPLPYYEIDPQEYCVLIPSDYPVTVGATQFIKLENFPYFNLSGDSVKLIDKEGKFIDLLVYDTEYYHSEIYKNGGYSLEKINIIPECDGIHNWHASENIRGGTPGAENSVAGKDIPSKEFAVEQVRVLGSDTIQFQFNVQLNPTSLIIDNFRIDNLFIQDYWSEKHSLFIKFSQAIQPGELYQLEVIDLSLCSGEMVQDMTIPFGIGVAPSFNELIVTELMVKPGGMDLMQHEYIEVYNASGHLLTLENLRFGDEKDMSNFPAILLGPAEYLVLSTTTGIKSFNVPNASSVSGWPGFNDEGQVLIIDQSENLIFNLDYNLNELEPKEKSSGGWSMEIIDLKNPCHFKSNWTFSNHPAGGTPGMKNSVAGDNADRIDPHLKEVIALSPLLIQLTFNENLIPSEISEKNLTINPLIEFKDWHWIQSNQLQIKLIDSLKPGVEYNCILHGLMDCAGNYLEEKPYSFFLPQKAIVGDVRINEILFEPFSGGVEFFEILNVSAKVIDLYHWAFNTNNEYSEQNRIQSHILMQPGALLVFTTDPERVFSDYPKSEYENLRLNHSMPSLSNESDTLCLFDRNQALIDKVFYHTEFHSPMIDRTAGVSLERIDARIDALNQNNWHSAAATIGFASPGYINSSVKIFEDTPKHLQVDPVVMSPNQDGYQDFSRLTYNFDQPGKKGSMLILDARGRIVKKLFENLTLATSGTEIWQGENEQGTRVPQGYYILWLEVIDANGTRELFREKVVVTGM